jgi:phosphatidylglycerol lysyltransferase
VFYGIDSTQMVQLLDFGHAILKTGEVARVDLTTFTLEGPARKDLRYARSRAIRDGLRFDILARTDVPAHIGRLRAVSDAWLATRSGAEKGFSLGRFDAGYLAEFDLAVMWHDDKIVAFANLWRGADCHEISIDLMRHLPGQTPVLMDAMMTETILAAQAMGYHWFNLGGAPLSGLRNHPLASVWTRIGTMVYRRGDEFYSFEGLRNFKDKFGPVWSAVYMTCPGGLSIPRALIDVALLISRPKRLVEEDADTSDAAFPLTLPPSLSKDGA